MIVAIDTNCILPGQVGGIENYTLGLIEALKLPQSPAEKLLLLTRTENHALFSQFADERTQILLLERPTGSWAQLPEAQLNEFQQRKANLLRQHHVSLIHFPGNTVNPLDLDLPIVLNLHDLQHRHFPQYFTAEEIANRENWWVKSAMRADALIAASNFIRNDLCRELGVDRSRIFVTPDVFQSAFFKTPTPKQLADLRRRFALPEIFFLYPAAVWPHKNHAWLIRAFQSARIPDAQLVLTGGGQEKLQPASNVRPLGRISTEDLVGLYYMATALIFSSEYEAWSIPIMEAMACGCPVASSNVTSLPEQVGDAGLLFNPADISSMADAMRRLAGDEKLRQTLAERGRQRVKDFSPENFLKTISRAYESAAVNSRAKKTA